MDLLEMLVRFSLTGKFEGWDASVCDNAMFKNCYCSLNVLIKPDTVDKIEGLDEVLKMPEIYASTQMLYEGDVVKLPGTVQQIAFKFSLVASDKPKVLNAIDKIYETLKIFNKEGEDLKLKLDYRA